MNVIHVLESQKERWNTKLMLGGEKLYTMNMPYTRSSRAPSLLKKYLPVIGTAHELSHVD